MIIPTLLGEDFSTWLYRSLNFLVISCPCALVVSVPLGLFSGIGGASRKGILVKGGNHLEALKDVDTVVFDKTGTLTKGSFKVSKINSVNISKNKLIGNIVSNLLYLLYNGNVCVYLFGSELVNRIMLTNLDSLNQLSGNAFKYAVGVLLVLVMSLYPIKNRNKNNKQSIILLFVTIIVSTGLIFMFKENKNYIIIA